MSEQMQKIHAARDYIQARTSIRPQLAVILGSGLGARLGGFTRRQSLQLGIGMVSRGEVGLIVASVGILEEVITTAVFSEVVVMVIVTTLITPPMLRIAFAGEAKKVTV